MTSTPLRRMNRDLFQNQPLNPRARLTLAGFPREGDALGASAAFTRRSASRPRCRPVCPTTFGLWRNWSACSTRLWLLLRERLNILKRDLINVFFHHLKTFQPNDRMRTQIQSSPLPKLVLNRWSENHPVTGFGIEAQGKIPWLAGAGVAERQNHCTVISDEHLHFVKTGFSSAECEANGRLIASAPQLHADNAALRARLAAVEEALEKLCSDAEQASYHLSRHGERTRAKALDDQIDGALALLATPPAVPATE